jgi:hypothetical protein
MLPGVFLGIYGRDPNFLPRYRSKHSVMES